MSALSDAIDNLDFYQDPDQPFEVQMCEVARMFETLIKQSFGEHQKQFVNTLKLVDSVKTLAENILKLQARMAELEKNLNPESLEELKVVGRLLAKGYDA